MNRKRYFGKHICRLGTVGSTQDTLKDFFYQGAEEGTLVVAEDQIRGRGRRERQWHSMDGKGLLTSILLEPLGPEELWTWVSLWAGVVARQAIADLLSSRTDYHPESLKLKWPNDIMHGNRKLGGILVEKVQDGKDRQAAVLGLGINLLQQKEDFAPHLRSEVTSILMATGESFLPDALLEKLIISLENHYPLLKPVGAAKIKRLWMKHAWGLNSPMRVTVSERSYEGIFCELGRFGEIGLALEGNQKIRLSSAERIELLSTL